MAVLYRTNAQSRSVEDGLRQADIAYVVLGGVGFYERKEIKDALAYLKLMLESLRRCRAAPGDQCAGARHRQGRDGRARAGQPRRERMTTGPPLLAGLAPAVVSNSLWQKLVTAIDQRCSLRDSSRR